MGRVAREVVGSLEVEATGVAASALEGAALDGVSLLEDGVGDSVSMEEGLLNSTGLIFGVA